MFGLHTPPPTVTVLYVTWQRPLHPFPVGFTKSTSPASPSALCASHVIYFFKGTILKKTEICESLLSSTEEVKLCVCSFKDQREAKLLPDAPPPVHESSVSFSNRPVLQKQGGFSLSYWILIRNIYRAKQRDVLHKNPLKLSHEISKWQDWKCCQAQQLIGVCGSRRDIPLRSASPLCCCDLFSAAWSVWLGDKRVTCSLPVCATWAAKAKLAVDPADLPAPQSRKLNVYWQFLHPAICLDFVSAPNPTRPSHTSISTPQPLQLPVRQAAIGQNEARTRLRHSAWIKDSVARRGTAC